MTSVLRKRILRHLRECDVCQANRRRFASPAEIFGALTPVAAPIVLKEEIFSNLLAQWGAGPPPQPSIGPPSGLRQGLSRIIDLPRWVLGVAVASLGVGTAAAILGLTLFTGGEALLPDTVPPLDPMDARSSSHSIGTASRDNQITLLWTPAMDQHHPSDPEQEVSEVDGYSIEWSEEPNTLPDAVKDIDGLVSGTTSPPLPPGQWWFHLRTVDHAGNWTNTLHVGPFVIMAQVPATALPTAIPTPRSLAGKPLAGFCATPIRRIPVLCGTVVHVLR